MPSLCVCVCACVAATEKLCQQKYTSSSSVIHLHNVRRSLFLAEYDGDSDSTGIVDLLFVSCAL